MRTYNASWHGTKEKLRDFCDNFPYKELADDDKFYGLANQCLGTSCFRSTLLKSQKNLQKMPWKG